MSAASQEATLRTAVALTASDGGGEPPATHLERIRRDVRARLAELTFNSKPIIDALTHIAAESARAGNQDVCQLVVRLIEQQILHVQADIKLPALYVCDSILKNVAGVYRTLFSHNLVSTFTQMYDAVPDQTKYHMERVLKTWKEGKIFAAELLQQLDAHAQRHHQRMREQPSRPSAPVTHVQPAAYSKASQPRNVVPSGDFDAVYQRVLRELSTVLGHKQQLLQAHPLDPNLSKEFYTLQQLYQLVASRSLDIPKMELISTQIQPMWPPHLPRPQPSRPIVSTLPPPTAHPVHYAAAVPTNYTSTSPYPAPVHPPQQPQQPSHAAPVSFLPDSITQALRQLQNMDVLGSKGSSRIPYLTLTRLDLEARHEGAEHHLYGNLELQCNQCGFRFPKSVDGQDKMTAHMDWHFRLNRKRTNAEEVGKADSREWFLRAEDWLEMLESVDTTSRQGPLFSQAQEQLQDQVLEAKKRLHVTSKSISMDGAPKNCAICHEPFESYWDEEQEEWMYRNAMRPSRQSESVEGKEGEERKNDEEENAEASDGEAEAYHATCYLETFQGKEGDGDSTAESTDASVSATTTTGKRKLARGEDQRPPTKGKRSRK